MPTKGTASKRRRWRRDVLLQIPRKTVTVRVRVVRRMAGSTALRVDTVLLDVALLQWALFVQRALRQPVARDSSRYAKTSRVLSAVARQWSRKTASTSSRWTDHEAGFPVPRVCGNLSTG